MDSIVKAQTTAIISVLTIFVILHQQQQPQNQPQQQPSNQQRIVVHLQTDFVAMQW
jgi:hypothetical protein